MHQAKAASTFRNLGFIARLLPVILALVASLIFAVFQSRW